MPSVSDVYNQLVTANTTLTSIHNDGVAVRGAVDRVHAALDTGFGVLTADLQVIATIENQIDQGVLHLNQQTDSVLCILEQIAVGVCTLVNQGAEQVNLLKSIAADQHALREMYGTANPEAALTEARAQEMNAKLEQCCKPEPGTPPCVHKPCPTPPPLNLQPAPSTVPQYPHPQPCPSISAVAPSAGPTSGGNTVTITGCGFAHATAVHFGAVSAISFTVISDTVITAIAPAGAGTVPVTVTTLTGTTNGMPYTYTAAASSGATAVVR